jgi:diguanylate cyclase (GGDEF)-like protein
VVQTGQQLALSSLAVMANALGRSETLYRLLEIAAEEARAVLDAASVSVSRLEPGTVTVRTLINVGDLGPKEVRWPEDEVYTSRDAENLGRVVDELATWTACAADPECDTFELQLLRELGKESALGAPIVVDGQLWGEFYATRHRGSQPFSADDVAYVEVLIAMLGGAVSRALREESLQRLANHDPLTGLVNRRALDQHAALVFDVPPQTARSVTVVAFDLNGLKQVNDTLGHQVGDRFIKSAAHVLQAAFAGMPTSSVARVGGDEFTVLVADQDPAHVLHLADGLCQRVWRFVSGSGICAGASTAVLTDRSTLTPQDLFAAADRALYVAKRGRLATTVLADDLDGFLPGARGVSA